MPEGYTDPEFVELMLEKCNIVVAPGSGYGSAGKGFFRVALTQEDGRIEEAISRMKAQGIRFDMKASHSAAACSLT